MSEEKLFRIDFEKLAKDFKFKSTSLTHYQNNRYKLLPYTSSQIDNTLFMKFDGVASCFSRMICDKELKTEFNCVELIENVADEIGEYEGRNSREQFKNIIKSIFLEDNELVDFNIQTINYKSSVSVEVEIAKYLYSIFVDDEIKCIAKRNYNEDAENILYKLVLKALPKLKDEKAVYEGYRCCLPYVKDLFLKDFKFLISNHELYKNSLQRFLEFYYLFYVSQLSIKLARFEKADFNKVEKLYFSLGWESLSKNRTAYLNGWNYLKGCTAPLFSHAILLELLNHSNIDKQLNYVDLYKIFSNENSDEIDNDIERLCNEYLERRRDGIDWDKYRTKNYNSGNRTFDRVHDLFCVIEYQFENTTRLRKRQLYKDWFDKFVEGRFAKKRGPLGYCLSLNEEDIILLTKLCINTNEKLKLNDLFNKFKERGISFDRDSKIKIVELYEKLNLIEKKSDSGDAQYVKSIL